MTLFWSITESQEDIREPHDDIREEQELKPTIIQQQPETPQPQTPEREFRPPTPKAPKITKRQQEPIDELVKHYHLTEDQKDTATGYPLQVQKDFLRILKSNNFPPLDTPELLRQFKNLYNIYHLAKGKQPANPSLRERPSQATSSVLSAVLPSPGHAYIIIQ